MDGGLRTADMETAAVAALAQHVGRPAVALLAVRVAPSDGKSFLDPPSRALSQTQRHAGTQILDVALDLAMEENGACAALGLAPGSEIRDDAGEQTNEDE